MSSLQCHPNNRATRNGDAGNDALENLQGDHEAQPDYGGIKGKTKWLFNSMGKKSELNAMRQPKRQKYMQLSKASILTSIGHDAKAQRPQPISPPVPWLALAVPIHYPAWAPTAHVDFAIPGQEPIWQLGAPLQPPTWVQDHCGQRVVGMIPSPGNVEFSSLHDYASRCMVGTKANIAPESTPAGAQPGPNLELKPKPFDARTTSNTTMVVATTSVNPKVAPATACTSATMGQPSEMASNNMRTFLHPTPPQVSKDGDLLKQAYAAFKFDGHLSHDNGMVTISVSQQAGHARKAAKRVYHNSPSKSVVTSVMSMEDEPRYACIEGHATCGEACRDNMPASLQPYLMDDDDIDINNAMACIDTDSFAMQSGIESVLVVDTGASTTTRVAVNANESNKGVVDVDHVVPTTPNKKVALAGFAFKDVDHLASNDSKGVTGACVAEELVEFVDDLLRNGLRVDDLLADYISGCASEACYHTLACLTPPVAYERVNAWNGEDAAMHCRSELHNAQCIGVDAQLALFASCAVGLAKQMA